jgi:hypothetical protein
VSASSCKQDEGMRMSPVVQVLEIINLWESKFFSKLLLVGIFIDFKQAFGTEFSVVLNPSKLGSE